MEILETRVRKKGHVDLQTADLFIGGKRRQCFKLNEDYIFRKMKDSGKLFKINPNQVTFKKLAISSPGAFYGTFLLNGSPGAFFGTFDN